MHHINDSSNEAAATTLEALQARCRAYRTEVRAGRVPELPTAILDDLLAYLLAYFRTPEAAPESPAPQDVPRMDVPKVTYSRVGSKGRIWIAGTYSVFEVDSHDVVVHDGAQGIAASIQAALTALWPHPVPGGSELLHDPHHPDCALARVLAENGKEIL